MTAGPGDKAVTGKSRDRGRLRASDSEREQVAGALQAAFVQGRLTQEELSARVEQTYAAKTHADLAEVIADLPTELTGTRSQRASWRATKRAWWFEYAAFLPGIVAIILLPPGPSTTIWTLIVFLAVIYPVLLDSRRSQDGRLTARQALQRAAVAAAALPGDRISPGREGTRPATEDELEARTAQVPTAPSVWSRADQDALIADLPADMTARRPLALEAGWRRGGQHCRGRLARSPPAGGIRQLPGVHDRRTVRRHRAPGPARHRGPDRRRTASGAGRRAAAAGTSPQPRQLIAKPARVPDLPRPPAASSATNWPAGRRRPALPIAAVAALLAWRHRGAAPAADATEAPSSG